VTPDVPVAEAIRRAREAGARALVVVDSTGRPSGLVSEAAVSALPAQRQPWVLVGDVSRPIDPGLVLQLGMDGESLVEAVQTHPATEYLVVDRSEAVVGVLSRIDLVSALQSAGLR
jgi:CBS domain-containing protein